MGFVLTIYSSINFVAVLLLECKIYQESKNDKPTDLYFILLLIFKILEKYNLQIIDIFTCFSIRAGSIILLHLESLESSLKTIGENTELCRNIKKRFKKLTK